MTLLRNIYDTLCIGDWVEGNCISIKILECKDRNPPLRPHTILLYTFRKGVVIAEKKLECRLRKPSPIPHPILSSTWFLSKKEDF